MLSNKLDFNSCAIRDGFCKSSHIRSMVALQVVLCNDTHVTISNDGQ